MLHPGRHRAALALALCATPLVACNTDGSADKPIADGAHSAEAVQRVLPTPRIRDSAGIRIVEYHTLGPMPPGSSTVPRNPLRLALADLPPAVQLESQPFLDLGGVNANEQAEFDATHPMLSATELSNGTIVVNDRTQLKYFTRTGAFIRAVGRRGMGPGEFQQTRAVCRFPGDTLLVIDYSGDRLTLWDANGEFISMYPRLGRVHACHANGTLVVQNAVIQATTNAQGDQVGEYELRRPDGSIVRALGTLPIIRSAGGLARAPSVIPVGNELYIGNARIFEVRVQHIDGRVRRITRLSGPLVPITDEAWRERAKNMVPGSATAELREQLARFTAIKPFDAYPAFSKVHVDPAGRTWIQDFESLASWTVLDSSGVIMGRFNVPP